jgi:hypothetical protein
MINPIAILFYLTVFLSTYHLIKFLKNNKTIYESVAGNVDDCDKLPPNKKIRKPIKLKINDSIVSSHDKHIFVGKACGSSMKQLNGPINNDLFFTDTDVGIDTLKKDSFMVLKTTNNGNYCYKLRRFISYNIATKTITSETYGMDGRRTSDHTLDQYIGKIIASFAA